MYYLCPKSLRNVVLTVSSYIFYAWATPYFIVLIAWSTIVDFVCGNFIYGHWKIISSKETGERWSSVQKKLFLTISLVSNIGMLGFFKYFTFAESNLNALLVQTGYAAFPLITVA